MAQSYAQLQLKIKALQEQADRIREQEIHGVVERIKVAIAHYGLTPNHLFGDGEKATRTVALASSAKYSDGRGNSWSGKGKRPNWLRQALEAGRPLEEFIVGSVAASKPSGIATPKRRAAKASYRDGAGNTWSGFGPRPKWLKDAIAAGQNEESLRA
ncbi:H-NS family nucleoid-associated regulatory protein [Variovorax sp. dw_308]|uniref:H-NS family nucleoid-associated regulatory protein n=1 Tax=Variovorax sp. dw_308 TaxID=2721546 RepID=UPI001C44BD88|nr:H-NS family nucleoid-associated regulatory protein [Variovorax sp. dw_308]